jgi:hypothetical protein
MTENEAIKELETSIDLAKMCTQNYERKKRNPRLRDGNQVTGRSTAVPPDWHGGGMP